MKKWNSFPGVWILIIVLVLQSSLIFGVTKDGYISWEAVPDASGYIVEIRNQKKEVVSRKKTKKNYFELNLPKGEYEVRTGILNLFEKIAVWSRWEQIRVQVAKKPEIKKDPGKVEAMPTKNFKTEIEAEHVTESTQASLENEKKHIPAKAKPVKDSTKVEISADLTKADPGKYDLVLENPHKKTTTLKDFITVQPKKGKLVTAEEFIGYLKSLKKTCSEDIPDQIITNCHGQGKFFTINMKDGDKARVYNFVKIDGTNSIQRIAAYKFFSKSCPIFNPALDQMETVAKKMKGQFEENELKILEISIAKMKSCPPVE